MKRLLLLGFTLFAAVSQVEAAYGYFGNCATFIEFGNLYYKVGGCSANDPNFDGANLGVNLTTLVMDNIQQYTYENGGDDVLSGFLHYRVYPSSGSPGGFTQVRLEMVSILGGGDERREAFLNLDLIQGLLPGTEYKLEVYFRAEVDWNPTNGSVDAEFFDNNNAKNYTATFSTAGVLPVVFNHFTGKAHQGITHLTWATATETNNSHFEVQRSADGRKWAVLGEVKGAGTIQEPQQYEFTDAYPPAGLSYYRLRQVDYDGQYAYSPVVAVNRKGEGYSFSVFPNPASDHIQAVLPAGEEGVVAELYNGRGQRIRQQPLHSDNGKEEVQLIGLPAGIYYLSILDGRGRQLGVQRFVKK